eukprot:2516694-Pyramimonas_sp.AAC.2
MDVERARHVRGTCLSIVRQRRKHDASEAKAVLHRGHTFVQMGMERTFLIWCARTNPFVDNCAVLAVRAVAFVRRCALGAPRISSDAMIPTGLCTRNILAALAGSRRP